MKSVMSHQFSQVPSVSMERSLIDRSFGHKTTIFAGDLVPIVVDDVLPGDTFNLQHHILARMETPVVPVMDNMFLDTFYFFVPFRLLWQHWVNMMGEEQSPGDFATVNTEYMCPKVVDSVNVTKVAWTRHSLGDYFGCPVGVPVEMSAMHCRAYNKIYNDWFRDENLQYKVSELTTDADNHDTDFAIQKRGKRHDYFTSALPWPQKGPGVEIPLGSTAPVMGNGKALGIYYDTNNICGVFNSGGFPLDASKFTNQTIPVNAGATASGSTPGGNNKYFGVSTNPAMSGLVADLSSASAATINSLRTAFQLQKLYERDARGGTRYVEIILSHFGVRSPDYRLQRPEYLGGGSQRISMTPVQQTSAISGQPTPQGNLAAYAMCFDGGKGFRQSFTEHGCIIGIVNVRCDLTYQQGLPRMFSKRTRFDFYWPSLAHLGEQEILNKEIYATNTATDEQVFGYQERYAEYRYKPSMITGQLRSTDALSLDIWHLSEEFGSLPALGATFIEDNSEEIIRRVLAVPGTSPNYTPQFKLDCYFDYKCARPMPIYSVPGLIDHF